MTSQQKAKELVNKFYRIIPLDKMTIDFDLAKNCALIAVEEILEDNRISYMILGVGINKYYWLEVKKEIEAL